MKLSLLYLKIFILHFPEAVSCLLMEEVTDMVFLVKTLLLSRAQQLLLIQWTLVLQCYDKFQIKDFISRYELYRMTHGMSSMITV